MWLIQPFFFVTLMKRLLMLYHSYVDGRTCWPLCHTLSILLILLLPRVGHTADTRTAWVSWVIDGDTVMVVREGQHEPVKFRIEGIDAPETCQPGGVEARDALIRLALRKSVQVVDHGHDTYGRQIGRLSVGGEDLGAEMVRSGMAWAYSFRTGRGIYASLQRQAKKQKVGVFAVPNEAMSPPVFRKFHGTCYGP